MRLLVFGAGAIGTYVGGSLALSGHAVTFFIRPQTASLLRLQGFHLRQDGRHLSIDNVMITSSLADALLVPQEAILFALKSYDTKQALEDLRAATAAPPPIVCLQNGVNNEAEIARVFGAGRVIAGTVTTAVSRRSAGDITIERKRGLGLAVTHPLSAALIAALNDAGLHTRGYASAESMKWSKLLTNLVGNATSAILDLPVATIFEETRLFDLEMAMLRECLAVMRAKGIGLVDLPGTPVRALALATALPAFLARPLLRRAVASGRGGKWPSFHVDLHSGRGRTEVNWLNGVVVRHGADCGVPAPVNRLLTETLEALSAGRKSPDELRGKPEALLRLMK